MERKISDQNKQEVIYMPWKEFYKFIYKQENFSYLNGKNRE